MQLLRKVIFRLGFICLFWFCPLVCPAQQADVAAYGLPPLSGNAKRDIAQDGKSAMDSLLRHHPQLKKEKVLYAVARDRIFNDRTADFYLLIALFLLLGFIRLTDPKYFQILWQAFRTSSSSTRQLKEKLQSASFSNLLMNLFFTIAAAVYGFFVIRNFMPALPSVLAPPLLLLMLIGGVIAVYLGKFAVIRFSGWAFRVESITEYYLFNVFLVNKVLSIILLPLIVLLAFADQTIAQPVLIISFFLILFFFINRYLRSWHVFGSFFQYSKFHFFTYLCASELLPLAVLMKLLVRGLL